ncbi:putative PWI domain-containing protein [Mycena sanguinolenta]|uniref:Putative PWI domain-containing protein n=1 Tax=Mycena sanguinolenta TaxID=230812 RepID=A0A8H7D3M9_9AGAR|nr:putative PWI domain-containing protein [Mycena sanguinolenta]
MADAGFFKGTSADQDRRFADKEQKLLKSTKFPSHFEKKVDMRKVNLNVIKPWIAKKNRGTHPRKMQLSLTAFLAKDAPVFMSALWTLLLEAQTEVTGVPRTFVEEKKEEMRKARENDTRAFDERDRRVEASTMTVAAEDSTTSVEEAEVADAIRAGVVAVVVEEAAGRLPIVVHAPALALAVLVRLRLQDADTVLRRDDGPRRATSTAPAPHLQTDAEARRGARPPTLGPAPVRGRVLTLVAHYQQEDVGLARPRTRHPATATAGAPFAADATAAAPPTRRRRISPSDRSSRSRSRTPPRGGGGRRRNSPLVSTLPLPASQPQPQPREAERQNAREQQESESTDSRRKMAVDVDSGGELKIKGQAEVERRKSIRED